MRSLPILVDGQERRVTYLRVSVTDRCNYRCTYCMPEEGVDLVPKPDVLTFEELERLVGALVPLGVRRVRLTGGEPTVRKDLVELVGRLAALGLDDLALTTNGQRLAELAGPLKQAGLTRLNVSVDTLDAPRFRAITRRGDLDAVLAGLEAAHTVGFRGTKLNAVVMGGVNDDELAALCRFSWAREIVPRFIEFMPMSEGALFSPGTFVPAAEVRARLERELGPLIPDEGSGVPGVGPARHHRVLQGPFAGRRLGLISAVTEPFCETCNRVRLSATGMLHTCLALDDEADLRTPLRAGASDAALRDLVRHAVGMKKPGHTFTACGAGGPRKHMVAIGG
jgi:cyclic pyranopterin phosphate synthase